MTNFHSITTSTPAPGNRGAEIFTQPIEIIFRLNAGIINAFQSATVSWMQRGQEAARDTIESCEKASIEMGAIMVAPWPTLAKLIAPWSLGAGRNAKRLRGQR